MLLNIVGRNFIKLYALRYIYIRLSDLMNQDMHYPHNV